MQRKVILGLLLLCSVCAWAQQSTMKKVRKKKKPNIVLTGTPVPGGVSLGVQVPLGPRKEGPDVKSPNRTAPIVDTTIRIDYRKIGTPMPAIWAVTATGEVITDTMLRNGANLFVMMFNPTCEHCEDMTRDIEKHIGLFKKSQIVLLAAPMMGPYLEYFDKTTHYTQFPSLKVGIDSAKFIDRTFNYEMLPQINVYDKDRKLIRSFSGISTVDSLRAYIQ
jgi:hypothetical protein